jgi:hypothetical protein
MPPRIPSTMVRASAWASACFGAIGMTRKGGATVMGTVKAGPIGIRVIYEHASSGGEDRQNIVRARIGGLHECAGMVNRTRVNHRHTARAIRRNCPVPC